MNRTSNIEQLLNSQLAELGMNFDFLDSILISDSGSVGNEVEQGPSVPMTAPVAANKSKSVPSTMTDSPHSCPPENVFKRMRDEHKQSIDPQVFGAMASPDNSAAHDISWLMAHKAELSPAKPKQARTTTQRDHPFESVLRFHSQNQSQRNSPHAGASSSANNNPNPSSSSLLKVARSESVPSKSEAGSGSLASDANNNNKLGQGTSSELSDPYDDHDHDEVNIAGVKATDVLGMTPAERELVLLKRKLRNRESAKRTRNRRLMNVQKLNEEFIQLRERTENLNLHVQRLIEENNRLMGENQHLKYIIQVQNVHMNPMDPQNQ